jgi:exosortase C (VPDSG-CTERM-specific)
LAKVGWTQALHSHVLLVPFISWYLVRTGKKEARDGLKAEGRAVGGGENVSEVERRGQTPPSLRRAELRRPGGLAAHRESDVAGKGSGIVWVLGGLGLVLGVLGMFLGKWVTGSGPIDALALQTAGFILCVVAVFAWIHGSGFVRQHAFAFAFLVFMIPMPPVVENAVEIFFQNWSAHAAELLFRVTGTSYLRFERTFELPGLTIQVAQECSGIRSSYVLFIVSLLAGHLFLRRTWTRVALTLFVIPLGILRNGFRILTISLLTVHVDPGVIHGPLHHRGGPVFFVLSLVPFFAAIWLLRKWEKRSEIPSPISQIANPKSEIPNN